MCFARPQPFSQSGQPDPFKAQSIRICRHREPSGEEDGLCDICAHFRRIQALVQGRALPPWHDAAASSLLQGAADALAAMARGDPPTRGHREGSRSRSRSPCSPPGNGGKGKGKGKNKGKHSGKGNGGKGNGGTWIIWFARLPRLPQMPLQPCCVDESGSVGFIDVFDVQRSSRHACERRRKKKCSAPALPGEPAESPKPPFLGERIGEAANPGPPDDAASRRDRTLHALAQMGLCRPAAPASDAETLSDTLSAHTPFATPREDCAWARPPVLPPAARGDAPPTMPDHTTPGYSPASDGSLPPQSDVRAAGSATRARCVFGHTRPMRVA